jgi:exopolysaccharide biosynthesis polyprenyl glycosylphosphotransferase
MIRLFHTFIPTSVLGLLFFELLIVTSFYLVPCYWMIDEGVWLFLFDLNGLPRLALVVASVLGGLYFNDFYTNIRVRSQVLLLQQICLTIGVTFLIQAGIAYVNPNWRMPRRVMLAGSVACLFLLPAWRIFYNKSVLRILGGEKLLFIGSDPLVNQVAAYLAEHPEFGFRAIGYVAENPSQPSEGPNPTLPLLGSFRDLRRVVMQQSPSRLIVALDPDKTETIPELLAAIRHPGARIEDIATLYEIAFTRICLNRLRPEDLLATGRLKPVHQSLAFHSALSLGMAVIGIILSAPIMLIVAIAVRLSSPGPVLFRQKRVGEDNRPFTLYKFRSMYVDAEAGTGAVWAKENDPRVTPLGRWLRLLRLDELPQLFNVARGEMAIVGPRPERPEFVQMLAEEVPFYLQRHSVKPGITGWAQINYKYGSSLEDAKMKLEYDLYYIKNLSLALDLLIIFHTAKTMLSTRGAT